MIATVVALFFLIAATPWWVSRAHAERRLTGLAGADGVPKTCVPLDLGVLLELHAAAVAAGASVPRALEVVGRAVGGAEGAVLHRVAAAIVLGARWDDAWVDTPARFDVLRRALRSAWEHGAAPVITLRSAGEQLRAGQRAATRSAAARLGVQLVLPLGTCFLPAFVLIGLLPLLISLGAGFLGG